MIAPKAFVQAPICAGSPTDGSQYAYEALRPILQAHAPCARFCPLAPSPYRGMPSPPGLRALDEVVDISTRLYHTLTNLHREGFFPTVIGGDHSVAMGSIAAAAEHVGAEALSVIWIDGHTDINTDQTSESGCIHGMPLAQAMGLCRDALSIGREKRHLYGDNLIIIGARSIDAGEYPILAAEGVHLFTAADIARDGIEAVLRKATACVTTPYVHVSFDVDCMDGALFPATGYRMPDGLTLDQAASALAAALTSATPISLDLVEYNPRLDTPAGDCAAMLDSLLTRVGL